MPLNVGKLANGLQKWMDSPQEDIKESAQLFADAYEDYAKGAIATSGGSIASYDKAGMLKVLTGITTYGVDFLEEAGAEVYAPSAEELQMFRDAAIPAVLEAIEDDMGEAGLDFANRLLEAVEQVEAELYK